MHIEATHLALKGGGNFGNSFGPAQQAGAEKMMECNTDVPTDCSDLWTTPRKSQALRPGTQRLKNDRKMGATDRFFC